MKKSTHPHTTMFDRSARQSDESNRPNKPKGKGRATSIEQLDQLQQDALQTVQGLLDAQPALIASVAAGNKGAAAEATANSATVGRLVRTLDRYNQELER
jgi:hypothetical protein